MADLEKRIDAALHQGRMTAKWKHRRGIPGVMAPLSWSGDYVVSHRPGEHNVSYRPPGQHHHVGEYRSSRAAHAAALTHAVGGKRRHGSSDPDVVDVLFRVAKAGSFKGTVEAWFPGLPGTNDGNMTTYAHVGQHSTGDPSYMRSRTRAAKPSEYASLKRELESIGYKLHVVQKATAKHLHQRRVAMAAMGY